MKQATMTAPGHIEITEVPRPQPRRGHVLLRIARIGICGSDIHVNHGTHPYTGYPVIQGHEVSGTVAALGDGVTGFPVGETVTLTPQMVCGECHACRHGIYNVCETLRVMGFQTDGAAREYFEIPAWNVLPVPTTMSLDTAAMVEPVAVAVHALNQGGGAVDRNVLVLGAGTIGNLVAQVARASGAKGVMITDMQDYKLEQARACGFDAVVNSRDRDVRQEAPRHFGPDRADLILECAGVAATLSEAIESARKGTTIVVVGVHGEKPPVNVGFIQDRELRLVGSAMYRKEDFEQAIDVISAGAMRLEPLITHRFTLDEYSAAYQAIDRSEGRYMKVMIDVSR